MKEIDKEALKANKVLSIKDVEADLKEIEKFNWRNNINYKLKDFVTDEMLIECGFVLQGSKEKYHAYWANRKQEPELYISLNKYAVGECRKLAFNYHKDDRKDITPYIQDLIEKGYVEAIE